MKYRHEFHAGNFADVHKHVTLVALLRALQRKETGLLYFESHAGRGWYARGSERHLGQEIRDGYARVAHATPVAAEINDYLTLERTAAESESSAAALAAGPLSATAAYAGSPLLAAALLRPQDRGISCELLASECRALKQSVYRWPRMQTLCADGMQTLRAHLPPRERRALLLIDPPYEEDSEPDAALAAIREALTRLPSAVIALWYPIKDDRVLGPWLRRCAAALKTPTLQCELWCHPRDSRVALNGSGMLIVNAPYRLDEAMQHWLPELGTLLDPEAQGGTSLQWLVQERTHES